MNRPQDVNPNQKPTAAEAVVASELRYRRLFESAKDGILILDAETGMVVDVNPFLSELLGFSHANLVGKKVWELGFLKDIIASEAHFAELQAKEYIRFEDLPLETAAGRRIDVEFVSNVYLVNHHKVQHPRHYRAQAGGDGIEYIATTPRRDSRRDTRAGFLEGQAACLLGL